MKIGFCLPTETENMGEDTASGADVLRLARRAEAVGFDSVWLVDHFCYSAAAEMEALGATPPPELVGKVYGAWECLTTAAVLARETQRVEIGTLVVNTGYRNPALLARMADTIDEFSQGRLILGLGAGDAVSEHRAFGYSWERRVARFEEALQIIRPLLRGETVTFEGEFYRTEGAQNVPRGPRPTGPPIMIGMLHGGPRMRRLIAQYADAWNCWLASTDSHPAAYAPIRDAMVEACERHGRDPATLARNVTARICPPGGAPKAEDMKPLRGSPAQVADTIAEFESLGVTHIGLWPHPNVEASIDFLAEVIEACRR